MAKPLDGVRILDLSRVLAGPFCTMLLSDLGAEIIKVELPGTGDDSRAFGPFKNGKSLYFINVNRGKKSIAIDLKSPDGKKLLLDLAKNCDVLVENYRPGTMEKLGLGWEVLKKENPRLIYAAVSGYGHTGPDSLKPSYDILAQARGGVMSITGWPDSPPTRVGYSTGDITAAIFCAAGINSALYQREKTGLGQKIDVSMLDCLLSVLENALVRYQVDGKPPAPLGTRHPSITPFQAFCGEDSWFVIAIGNDALWKNFCTAVNRPDLLADVRFSSNGERTKNIAALIPELESMFKTKKTGEWLSVLEKAGVPCARVNTVEDLMKDEQILARNMLVTVDDTEAGVITIPGNPVKMEMLPETQTREKAPDIGQHTDEILKSILEYSSQKINELRKNGAVQ
ncbi:MAG: CoA transferase [Treponema sp.]|jgi:CoA:oxalate CoA-transferase|nr:CoA transferase [Treponema sp.]